MKEGEALERGGMELEKLRIGRCLKVQVELAKRRARACVGLGMLHESMSIVYSVGCKREYLILINVNIIYVRVGCGI